MVFLSVCIALYDYIPQSDGELAIQEGELVYILEKSTEDAWWKAKKRASGEGEDEPAGLIPNNYVEEAQPTHHAKALYDYARQTEEELSFSQDTELLVYDTSDPDWTLIGFDGEFGFAPAIYIELMDEAEHKSPSPTISPQLPERPAERELPPTPTSPTNPVQNPAAALAGMIHKQSTYISSPPQQYSSSEPRLPSRNQQFTPEISDDDRSTAPFPSLPQRPISQQPSPPLAETGSLEAPGVTESPPYNRARGVSDDYAAQSSLGGFHLYNINEMISIMGKQKKMPTTLGINLATGNIMISPEKSRDGPQQEWSAEKLTHYSIEGKHVFMELIRPSKSIDFHAGAKDTAMEIVSALGELAGAARAEGLREVIAASSGSGRGQKKGQILYDFMAQGDDEVTIAVGDEVLILDDMKSEEWWMVRRLKNGKEGVVPSSYVEVTGTAAVPPSIAGINVGKSTVEQNRLEEERLTKMALGSTKKREASNSKGSEVGPGMKLPKRGSSLLGGHDNNKMSSQQSRRETRSHGRSSNSSKSKPDAAKTRTWTDKSGNFKVDAEFIGLKDGKIHLHKLNGVKIAVPVEKMAIEDLEYVEQVTGESLDEDKPLSDIRRRTQKGANSVDRSKAQPATPRTSASGASVQVPKKPETKKPEYDWFDFFLSCGVSPYHCDRYSSSFNKDSMDDTILPEITSDVLRTLGLKEGDILKVMKFLDNKFGRGGAKSKLRNVSFGGEEVVGNEDEDGIASPNGGLFSGPGGTLKNNTRKGRPAPAVQTNDMVDPKAFQQTSPTVEPMAVTKREAVTPLASASKLNSKVAGGFDDNAWDVKPSKQAVTTSPPPSAPHSAAISVPSQPTLSGSMADLSLLAQPLQPVIAHNTGFNQRLPNQEMNASPKQIVSQQPQFQSQQQQPQMQNLALPQMPQQQQQQPAPAMQNFQPQPHLQQQSTGASPSFFASLGQQSNGVQFQPNTMAQAPPLQSFNSQPTGLNQSQFQLNAAPRQRPQPPQFNQQGSLMPPPPPRPLSAPQNVSAQNNFNLPPLQPQLTGVPNQGIYQQQVASPGQSLNDLNKLRLQQQFNQQQRPPQISLQPTGFSQMGQNSNQSSNGFVQQPNTYGQQPQMPPQPTGVQPSPMYMNGQQIGSPFADPRSTPQQGGLQPQATGMMGLSPSFYSPMMPQQTGTINSVLAPALQPQQTGTNGFNRAGFGQPPPPLPPINQQQTIAPLQPQKTGPAPPVRFGVAPETKKLVSQPTGRKANLSQATPQNPFGF